jgi:preprotein translocase subunit SecA
VDLQLRGRAGRQGDPGESRFFISLEDDLLVRYGLEALIANRFVPNRSLDPVEHPIVRAEIGRAQRIVEGQNVEIRKTLWRYASVVESQRQTLMDRRQAILDGRLVPDIWSERPDDRAALVAAAGEDAVLRAERGVTLHHIDRAWRDHLSLVADVREGIHLVALGGADPLTRFTTDVTTAFHTLDDTIDQRVLDELSRVRVSGGLIDLSGVAITGPSATWTYLVNDDPFRNQIGMLLTGPGRTTIAINAAALATPLLLLWGVVDRFFRRRGRGGRERDQARGM